MGRELGRISGPLLADNLLRNGVDLAVETSLLYLNVSNGYIGVNNNTPTRAFDITGTAYAPTVIVDTEADLSNLIFTTNQIQNLFDEINIVPDQTSNPNIVVPGLSTDKLTLKTNTITNYVSGDNLIISPTGQVVIGTPLANNNVLVDGNLHSTGDVTFDGNITLGSGPTNTISIPAEINSDIVPLTTNLYDLGQGPGSAQFTGSNRLSISTTTGFGFGTGDFTLEGWYYHTTGSANHRLFDFRTTEPQVAPMLGIGSINQIYLFVNGANRIIGTTLPLNLWTHIALVKSSGSTRLYVNGTQSGATYTDANNYGTTSPLCIGADYQGSNGYVGSMTNIRVVKGTAVYSGTFTPPTLPLAATQKSSTNIRAITSGTQLLLLQTSSNTLLFDKSGNNRTVTNNNSVVYNSASPFAGSLYWNSIYANGLQVGPVTTTNIVTNSMTIGNITINSNSITDNLTNDNLQFTVSGTGVINLNNTLSIKDNAITYNQNSPLNFNFASDPVTGAQNGYLKFGGANGFVPPTGTTAQRPLNAEIGTLRFNSELSILEVYANIANTVTSFDVTTNTTVNSGTSIIYTTSTTGIKVGDLVTGVSLPGAFSVNTLVSTINPGVSFTISNPLLLQLPSGSVVNALQQWVPSIGLSPVLSLEEVTETMDIWTLILG
jgi:hypothetical protein